jgi:hypothetical protein
MRWTRTTAAAAVLALGACDETGTMGVQLGFLDGTDDNPQIGLIVNSLGRSVTLFQLGDPAERREVALGASSAVTPIAISVRGSRAAVPLGNAASAALLDLQGLRPVRFFLFPSGNATGSVFADEQTVFVANLVDDVIGRFTVDQVSDDIVDVVSVAPAPSAVVMGGNEVLAISANLDDAFAPLGNGIVTAIDPITLDVRGSVETGGTNSSAGALGPDGLLYVVNTGDFVSPGSLTIIDPASLAEVETVGDMGVGPGAIFIDQGGLAYISGFFFGTIVWDTGTRQFVRDADDPVCARLMDGACRGAFDVETDADGDLYQVFFGSAAEGLDAAVFVYEAGTFALRDSLAAGLGASAIEIREF